MSASPPPARGGVVGVVLGLVGLVIALGVGGTVAYLQWVRPRLDVDATKPTESPAPPKAAAPGTFPLTCVDGVAEGTGTWTGTGPIVKVESGCRVTLRHVRLKGSTLFDKRVSNLDLVVEDAVIETTDVLSVDDGNMKVHLSGAKLSSPRAVFQTDANFELEAEDATLESTNDVAIRGGGNVRARATKIRGRVGGIEAGTSGALTVRLERASELTSAEGSALNAGAILKLEADGKSKIESARDAVGGGAIAEIQLYDATVTSAKGTAVAIQSGSVDLVGASVRGVQAGISAKVSLAALGVSKGAEVVAESGPAIRAPFNGRVVVDNALVRGDRAAVGEANLSLTARAGARLVGKHGGVDGGANFELDGTDATIDGGGGAGLHAGPGAKIAFRSGTLRGAPALRLDRRPARMDLEGTRVEGAQVFGP